MKKIRKKCLFSLFNFLRTLTGGQGSCWLVKQIYFLLVQAQFTIARSHKHLFICKCTALSVRGRLEFSTSVNSVDLYGKIAECFFCCFLSGIEFIPTENLFSLPAIQLMLTSGRAILYALNGLCFQLRNYTKSYCNIYCEESSFSLPCKNIFLLRIQLSHLYNYYSSVH